MNPRPRLIRSIPFWALIVGSLASALGGAYLLYDKLIGMDVRLLDGTATTSDVYVGQIWAVFGAVLVGAGVIGLLLALTVASLRAFAPAAAVAPVAEIAPAAAEESALPAASASDESAAPAAPAAAEDLGYESELGYEKAETTAAR